jgi:NAD(P)-dependent dehydrogenase (short-subunit alcohol dehydrogenase family)
MAIAQKLASLGATVYIVGRTERTLEQAAEKIRAEGNNCITYQADITKWGQVEELAQFVGKESSRCDILVNSAGIGCFGAGLGSGPQHQPARDVLHDQGIRTDDDRRQLRTRREYFQHRVEESSAERRCLCGIEVGTERVDLLGS